MAILLVFTTMLIGVVTWYIAKTVIVYNKARKLRLPIVITPVERMLHPIWAMLVMLLAPLIRQLPYNLGEFVDFDKWEWRFREKNKVHNRLGPIFLVVNTSGIKVMLADGAACEEMLYRYKEFIKPEVLYKPLDLFGQNVDTVNGEDWQRHRKITAPSFNERNVSYARRS
jgi:cytochrome P450